MTLSDLAIRLGQLIGKLVVLDTQVHDLLHAAVVEFPHGDDEPVLVGGLASLDVELGLRVQGDGSGQVGLQLLYVG